MTRSSARFSYAVCHGSRSGSGLLCETLWWTNIAGRPDLYFDAEPQRRYCREWGTQTFAEYLERVLDHATTPNGVCGLRLSELTPAQLTSDLGGAGRITDAKDIYSGLDHIQAVLSDMKYIWLARRDKVRQGVSLWRMRNTGIVRWRRGDPRPQHDLEFDFEEIREAVAEASKFDAFWQTYFTSRNITPLNIVYEDDLIHGAEAITRVVLTYVGVETPNDLVVGTPRRRLSDARTESFVDQYHAALANLSI